MICWHLLLVDDGLLSLIEVTRGGGEGGREGGRGERERERERERVRVSEGETKT